MENIARNTKFDLPNQLDEFVNNAFIEFPNRIAVMDGERIITYQELEIEVKKMCAEIKKLLPDQGSNIAVCMKRSIEMIVSCYAIVLSGCTYVPIEPAYPNDRKHAILQDSKCKLILTDTSEITFDYDIPHLNFSEINCMQIDKKFELTNKNDTAYIIYTSGSKGKPKGVEIGHAAICNTLCWLREEFSINSNDIIAFKTSIGFTDSIIELFLPVLCGAAIKVVSDIETHDMEKFCDMLLDVTILQIVPPHLKLLLVYLKQHAKGQLLSTLRWILNGGQAIYMDLVCEAANLLPQTTIANTYGMTECAVYSTCQILKTSDKEAFIGKAISNMEIYLIDGDEIIAKPDRIGEICLCGIGLMNGYTNDPELSEKSMPVFEQLGRRIYHTGDLGKWTKEGILAYCGRCDDQVKVNGKRIEICEIEAVISKSMPELQSAIVAVEDIKTENRIICFYSELNIDSSELRKKLALLLPEYMIPSKFIDIPKMPLTINRKIDKKKLVETYLLYSKSEKANDSIVHIWKALLPESDRIEGDFFEMGGDSLLAMKMLAMLDVIGYQVDYEKFRENATKEHLLELISYE